MANINSEHKCFKIMNMNIRKNVVLQINFDNNFAKSEQISLTQCCAGV